MKSKQRKVLAILCAAAFILTMLSGCGTPTQETIPPTDNNGVPVTTDDPSTEPSPDLWSPPPISFDPTQTDPDQIGELVIYLPPHSWYWLNPTINFYREIYPNVELIIEDIGNDYYAYSTRVSTELMAGSGPDIFFPTLMFDADMFKMADAGAFLDLNEFIEQDDSFNLDDYIKPVLDGGIFRGKRYLMPFEYNVNVFVSIPEKLDEIGFDMSEIGSPISFMDEIVRTMPKAQTNRNFKTMATGSMWWALHTASRMKYADFEANTVLPYEETLEKLVRAYKPYFSFDGAVYETHLRDLRNGVTMFGVCGNITDFFFLASQINTISDIQMNVIPDMNGKIHVRSTGAATIRSGSPNQQNAWNFIKLMLSPENQSRDTFQNMPVHKRSLIAHIERLYNFCDGVKDHFIFTKLSNEDVQAYIALITAIDYSSSFDSSQTNMMFHDYMMPFWEDKVSYETAIAGLKNDLRLYMSE
jgi:multiple sugar transport system substrate-binding protein